MACRRNRCKISRRGMLAAGAIGIVGSGIPRSPLVAHESDGPAPRGTARSCIYIFLSGGLSQHESFDPKPDAPAEIRGEFSPIATQTPGLFIAEHLPMLATRSNRYALCRSVTHASNDHSAGHHIMLTGRSDLPRGFDPNRPTPHDHPCIAAIVGEMMSARSHLPPAVVLPEKLVHFSGRIIPGQFAGQMGPLKQPLFIEASPFHSTSYGAYPTHSFDHQERGKPDERAFRAPSLSVPEELIGDRKEGRFHFLEMLERQSAWLDDASAVKSYARYRERAMGLLTDPAVRSALDVTRAPDHAQDRYGKNAFGWSLLMARQLVEAGVAFVQVHLGNDETWDTHGNAFPHLKDKLLPPMDRGVSALLDDLHESGLLESTLVVMAGEFGRTPKISHLREHYSLPGRDHWGAVQSVLLAGGGIQGGRVLGVSDKHGGFPIDHPVRPEDLAATMYDALGISSTAAWHDSADRPNLIYHGSPIARLFS